MLTLKQLKEHIANHYDPDDLVDLLEIDTQELLDRFDDKVIEHRWKFEDEEEDGED